MEAAGAGPVVGPADFEPLRLIGKGAFGKVLLVRHARTKAVYAMKVMHKRLLEMRDHVGYSRVEREIMGGVDHPFLVGLSFAFQTSSKLYLVMPYMAGGELFSHLNREGTLMEDAVRVYAAEMVLALEHLHSVGIVHRDLKPENVLLGADGHVCLTDYGLAKRLGTGRTQRAADAPEAEAVAAPPAAAGAGAAEQGEALAVRAAGSGSGPTTSPLADAAASGAGGEGRSVAAETVALAAAASAAAQADDEGRTRTICGTTEYMAPEMVSGQPYGTSVDWWALGALVYEMLTGRPPFNAHSKRRLVSKIMHDRVPMPKFLSRDCHSLLRGLLERNVDRRLGCQTSTMFETRGVQALRDHAFFAGVDWKALERKEVTPPLAVPLDHETDTQWFDECFTALPADDTWDWGEERRLDEDRAAERAKEARRRDGKAPTGKPSPRPPGASAGEIERAEAEDADRGREADAPRRSTRFRGFSFVYRGYEDDLSSATDAKLLADAELATLGPSVADDVLAQLSAALAPGARAGAVGDEDREPESAVAAAGAAVVDPAPATAAKGSPAPSKGSKGSPAPSKRGTGGRAKAGGGRAGGGRTKRGAPTAAALPAWMSAKHAAAPPAPAAARRGSGASPLAAAGGAATKRGPTAKPGPAPVMRADAPEWTPDAAGW